MHLVYLLAGSNLGDRLDKIHMAVQLVEKKVGKIKATSAIYETEPWGGVKQQPFLNQALQVYTSVEPLELLQLVKAIEKELGREQTVHWGPRVIDIDIMLMDEMVFNTAELTIPQLHLEERRFALIPLVEIAPNVIHPVLKMSTSELLRQCSDQSEVKRLD